MHITPVSGWDWLLMLGLCLKKKVQSKSNSLFSSGVNRNSYPTPFPVLLTPTDLLSVHHIYFLWNGNWAKEDPQQNCNEQLNLQYVRRELWEESSCEKKVINIPRGKTWNLTGDVWTLVVVEVGKVIFITYLSNSFIKIIKKQPTNQTHKKCTLLGNPSNSYYLSDIIFQNTITTTGISYQSFLQTGIKKLYPRQVFRSGTCHVEERQLYRRKESCWS